jgi:hypothetical protein
MDRRPELHQDLIEASGTSHVYFQPPKNLAMEYPAIRYEFSGDVVDYANGKIYRRRKQYQVTVIDRDPDTAISDRLLELESCAFDRFYISDGLNHYVHTIYK